MLQLTVFVESANKTEFAYLHQTANCLIFSLLLLPLLKSAKQRLVLKEWSVMLLVLMTFNNFSHLFIIFKVCIGDVIQNPLLWFSPYVLIVILASSSWQWCTSSSWQWHMYAFIMMFFVDDNFNKGFLPNMMYDLLICDNVKNLFDWFFHIPFHASAVCIHFHWCSLMMIILKLTSFLAIKRFFYSLKHFLLCF